MYANNTKFASSFICCSFVDGETKETFCFSNANFGTFKNFEIFCPPKPFGKISFLAKFVEAYSVRLNLYFWCPKVRQMQTYASM